MIRTKYDDIYKDPMFWVQVVVGVGAITLAARGTADDIIAKATDRLRGVTAFDGKRR
jgi:hypothetical protein